MAHKVKCCYCGSDFDRDYEPYIQVSARRYAHSKCVPQNKNYDEQVKEYNELEQYIRKLFGDSYIDVKVKKEIMDYKRNYNYTYSGMKKSLEWFYEIKKNPIEKANGGIAIIPWIYNDALKYYYDIFIANELNKGKTFLDAYGFSEVTISTPKKRVKKNIIDIEEILNE